jgi:hypothetical protein
LKDLSASPDTERADARLVERDHDPHFFDFVSPRLSYLEPEAPRKTIVLVMVGSGRFVSDRDATSCKSGFVGLEQFVQLPFRLTKLIVGLGHH